MKMKNKGKRGFTLTELVVVIAVLAIISTMVVSFSVMVNGSQRLAKAKVEALGDIRLAESVIENFINDASDSNNTNCYRSETMLANIEGDTLTFENGALNINKTGGENSTVNFEHITNITFSYHSTKENGADTIYYCKITYIVGDHEYDYTFCVNPYAGETINTTQGEGT